MDKSNRIGRILDKLFHIYVMVEVFLIVAMAIGGYVFKNPTAVDVIYQLGMCTTIIMGIFYFGGVCFGVSIWIMEIHGDAVNCDDEVFRTIDKYYLSWGGSNASSTRAIQIINLKYKEHGEVDVLVNKKGIDTLYRRMDFLRRRISDSREVFLEKNKVIIILVIVNILRLTNMGDMEWSAYMSVGDLIFGVLYTLNKYVLEYSPQNGIYKCEIKLLQEKIDTAERSLTIAEQDEKVLQTQQTVIELLIKKRRKSKRKKEQKELENSLEAIDKLNLCIHDYSDSYIREINIDGQTGYLVYDLEKGKENNYIGELNLKTQEFSKLYKILDQYRWISYLETTDCKIKQQQKKHSNQVWAKEKYLPPTYFTMSVM